MANQPSLKIPITAWSLSNQINPDGSLWDLEQRIRAVKNAGFDVYTCPADLPELKATLKKHGLRFGASFSAATVEEAEEFMHRSLAIEKGGPMNCQLGDHDTPVEKAIEMTIGMMDAAERLDVDLHLEMHRDTCTETPEKTYAIAEGFKRVKGRYPNINFDFSHPGSLKHLTAHNYIDRLFENVPLFQQSTLWHMRPFNGHHCQVPVTDGKGNFSPEYEDMRPFIRQGIDYWLAGPRPTNEFWIVPEIGPKQGLGYGLSCFPDSWQDAIILGHDIKKIWTEALNSSDPT